MRFFFFGEFNPPQPSEKELTNLVELGGAVILTETPTLPRSPQEVLSNSKTLVIICDKNSIKEEDAMKVYFKSGQYPLSLSWILDSMSHFTKLPFDDYRVTPISNNEPMQTQLSLDF